MSKYLLRKYISESRFIGWESREFGHAHWRGVQLPHWLLEPVFCVRLCSFHHSFSRSRNLRRGSVNPECNIFWKLVKRTGLVFLMIMMFTIPNGPTPLLQRHICWSRWRVMPTCFWAMEKWGPKESSNRSSLQKALLIKPSFVFFGGWGEINTEGLVDHDRSHPDWTPNVEPDLSSYPNHVNLEFTGAL